LEPATRKKEARRSPRKVLGARNEEKRGTTVAKKGSWSPQRGKKRHDGRQEKFLEPATRKKEAQRSPRKVLGVRNQPKSCTTVTKKLILVAIFFFSPSPSCFPHKTLTLCVYLNKENHPIGIINHIYFHKPLALFQIRLIIN
jgi:hypothetical protein